ncbi:MAG: MFS transporter [Rhodospirillaceae bacterium]|nr:MFS transporter [Rhodospirillaceae bacterium]
MTRANEHAADVWAEFRRGWPIVIVAAVGLACGLSALPIYSLGVFTKPLGEEFGWSRAEVQSIYTWMTIGNLVASPALGWLIDRHGVRLVCIFSLVGQALGFVALGLAGDTLVSFYAIGFVTAVIGVGTVPITWTRVIIDWFDKGRGRALGLALAGTGVSAAFIPSYTTWLLQEFGWRMAYVGLGALPIVLALPLSLWLLRDRTTGAATPTAPRTAAAEPAVVDVDFRTAVTGYRFWAMNVAFFLIGASVAGLIAHLIPMLTDGGMQPATAAQIAGVIGIAVIIGRIGTGYLIDRFWAPGVGLILLCLPILSCLLLAWGVGGVPGALLAALLIGLAAGAEFDLMSFLVSRYFGQRRYGIIYSCLYAIFKLSAGIGAPVFGLAYDTTGAYALILFSAIAALLAGSILLLCLGPYPAKSSGATAAPLRAADAAAPT